MFLNVLVVILLAVTTLGKKTLLEGDILISEERFKRVYGGTSFDKVKSNIAFTTEHGRGLELLNLTDYLWYERNQDGKLVIPWVYKTENDFSSSLRTDITLIMSTMESKLGVIKFVPRTNEVDYIELVEDDQNCASYVGRIGGNQEVFLHPDCVTQGIFEHEIMHVLGVFHEHTRTDRDDYVDVHFENIMEGYDGNFLRRSSDHTTDLGVGYDYGSVMHYGEYDFSKDWGVLKTIDARGQVVGQRDGMSPEDIEQLRLMYKCSDGPRHKSHFCSIDCLCFDGEGFCDLDVQCNGTLACTNGVCGTPRPTASPVTKAPTTPRPTRSPVSRTIDMTTMETFWVDKYGNIKLESIAILATAVFVFALFIYLVLHFINSNQYEEEYEHFGPYRMTKISIDK
jgi:hypothetical protein